MAIKSYLFRAEESLFDTIEQIRTKMNISTTKDAIVFLINSGVASVCMHHGINIQTKEEIITVPESTFTIPESTFTVPDNSFKLVDEDQGQQEQEEVSIEEG